MSDLDIPDQYRAEFATLCANIAKESKHLHRALKTVSPAPNFWSNEIRTSLSKITAWSNRIREIEMLSEAAESGA